MGHDRVQLRFDPSGLVVAQFLIPFFDRVLDAADQLSVDDFAADYHTHSLHLTLPV
jgi:hypothetical protein